MTSIFKVYIDLDDTLAHTSRTIKEKFGYEHYNLNDNPLKKSFKGILKDLKTWTHIRSNHDFWSELPVSHMGHEIYQSAKGLGCDVYILSALPKLVFPSKIFTFSHAANSKRVWLKEHFPEIPSDNIIICYAKEKHLQVKPLPEISILIDDSWRNMMKWRTAGGIAIHVTEDNLSLVKEKLLFIKNYTGLDIVRDFNATYSLLSTN